MSLSGCGSRSKVCGGWGEEEIGFTRSINNSSQATEGNAEHLGTDVGK